MFGEVLSRGFARIRQPSSRRRYGGNRAGEKKGLLEAGLFQCEPEVLCRAQPPVPGAGLVIGIELVVGIELVDGMVLVPIVPADVAMLGPVIGMDALEAGMLEAGEPIVPAAGALC